MPKRSKQSPGEPTGGKRYRGRITALRYVKASELREHPRQWRIHNSFQRKALDEVLARIGFAGALIARETSDGLVLLDGHLRREIAGDELVPVLIVDVDEKEADLLIAVWDPLSALATGDPEILAALTGSLTEPSEVLRQLLSRTLAEAGPILRGTDPEDIPPPPARPKSKPGDLIRLGDHRLLVADARSLSSYTRLMGKAKAQMMCTDPPFGVSIQGRTPRALRIQGDDAEGLPALLASSFAGAASVLSAGAGIYIFHPAGALQRVFLDAIDAQGWVVRQSLVWVKDSLVLGRSDWHYRHEPILYANTPSPRRFGRGGIGWYGGHSESSVLEVPRPKASALHPTSKPTELMRRLIANSSAPGDIVLDPYLGGGSSMIAAQQLGRRCYGIEIDPVYADVATTRWEAFTGQKATRSNDKKGLRHAG
jgi:DNA modification methylase